MKKKIFVIVLALTMLLGSAVSFAASYDLTNHVNPEMSFSFREFAGNVENFRYVADNLEEYYIEVGGNLYRANEVQEALDETQILFDSLMQEYFG